MLIMKRLLPSANFSQQKRFKDRMSKESHGAEVQSLLQIEDSGHWGQSLSPVLQTALFRTPIMSHKVHLHQQDLAESKKQFTPQRLH